MRLPITILGVLLFLSSCSDTSVEKNSNTADLPLQEKELKNAIEKFPDSLLLKENLIQYYCDNSNYSQAIAEVDKYIKKDTANARLWDIKATLHFQNKDTLNTIKAFEKAIEIFPDPQYIISLGTVYAQTKNPMALAMADALLNAPKANAQTQAFFIKGLYYNYNGDYVQAITFFNTCIQADYTFLDAYTEKTIALFDMGKYAEALKTSEKSVSIQSSYPDGYYWMGRCYEKLNNKNEAIANYKIALQLDDNYIEAKDALGKLGVK
ncbi:tetratricopeptide repeat protein [Ferruginibacter lapsinanis]|uniref:tetratricopeptide repeat protein n=1 Tax=Ferruginibacter lapsinanis TaxID=563172 RepID=UPI001E5A9C1A|nr:tetratricopeptide repeat protein [Ferruginibacter lapsinanis]UEG49689.1 tetratricopeptide repeat protein [Ferruginibacter lapsinanis]